MNPVQMQFLAMVLGFALWAALAYLKMVPIDPLIALLQMGLGGLVTHMLKSIGTDTAPDVKAAPQGGFARYSLIAMLACAAVAVTALAGCSTVMRGYEASAANEIRQANDNALSIWKAAACAMPVGAVLRDPAVIEAVNKFCGGGPAQLGASQPINITVQMPAAAASAAK